MKDIIITRHKATVEWLKEKFGIKDPEVLAHVTQGDIERLSKLTEGCRVFGILPIHIMDEIKKKTKCELYVPVLPNIPLELRGKELTKEDLKKLGGITLYKVEDLKLKKVDFIPKEDEKALRVIQYVEKLMEGY